MLSTVLTTSGSLPRVCRVHSSAICSGVEVRVPREPAEGIEVGEGQRRAEPCIAAHAGHADHAARAADGRRCRRESVSTGVEAITSDAQVEVEHLLPHGREVDQVPLLAGVLLRDLDFHGLAGVSRPANSGETGSRAWKSMGPSLVCTITLAANLPSRGWKMS